MGRGALVCGQWWTVAALARCWGWSIVDGRGEVEVVSTSTPKVVSVKGNGPGAWRRCGSDAAVAKASSRRPEGDEPEAALTWWTAAVVVEMEEERDPDDCLVPVFLSAATYMAEKGQALVAARLARRALSRTTRYRERAVSVVEASLKGARGFEIESPKRGAQIEDGDVAVRVDASGLAPHHQNDVALRVCTYLDEYALVSCTSPCTLTGLSPGEHRLTAVAYALPSGDEIGSRTTVFRVGSGQCWDRSLCNASRADAPLDERATPLAPGQGKLAWAAFTLVLNGMPFLARHASVLRGLGDNFEWHVVEGLALGRADARRPYSRASLDEFVRPDGLSVDGTSEYLDDLKREYPRNVFVSRPVGETRYWPDKIAMVNAALDSMRPGIRFVLQLDADELWTADRLLRASSEMDRRDADCAYFHCHFLVGPQLATVDGYGHSRAYEWLRLWRFDPARVYAASHAPPVFKDGFRRQHIFTTENCLDHSATAAVGAVFTHHAYTQDAQVAFKEAFYGYANATSLWRTLQKARPPVRLGDFLPWVDRDFPDTVADIPAFAASNVLGPFHTVAGAGLIPAPSFAEAAIERARASAAAVDASSNETPDSGFDRGEDHAGMKKNANEPSRPLVVVDGVAFQRHRGHGGIPRVWTSVLPLLARYQIRVVFLARGSAVPALSANTMSKLVVRAAPPLVDDRDHEADSVMLAMMCRGAAAFISTEYSSPARGPIQLFRGRIVALAHDLTPERFGWTEPFWRLKAAAFRHADALIAVSNATADALKLYYGRDAVVSRNGVDLGQQETLSSSPPPRASPARLGDDPYLLWVGPRAGYKNGLALFRALYHARASRVRVWLVGGDPLTDDERLLTSGPGYNLSVEYSPNLDDDRLLSAYAGAVALVYLSRDEGFGLPVLEAMAVGCPVIASDIPAFRSLLGHVALPDALDRGAVLVDPDRLTALWHAIRAFLHLRGFGNPDKRVAVAAALRHRASVFQGWHVLARDMYQALLPPDAPAPGS